MTQASTDSPTAVMQGLHERLDSILQLLQPGAANAATDRLVAELAEAHVQAGRTVLHGVTAVLRLWSIAMTPRVRGAAPIGEEERARLYAWFSGLRAYCRGELDASGQHELLQQLGKVPVLAAMPARVETFLKEKFAEAEPLVRQWAAQLRSSSASLPTAASNPDGEERAPEAADTRSPIHVETGALGGLLTLLLEDVLPRILALEEADAADSSRLQVELHASLGNLGEQISALGMRALARGVGAVQLGLQHGGNAVPPELVDWSTAIMAYLEQPCLETSDLLSGCVSTLEGWPAELAAETSRIQIVAGPVEPASPAAAQAAAFSEPRAEAASASPADGQDAVLPPSPVAESVDVAAAEHRTPEVPTAAEVEGTSQCIWVSQEELKLAFDAVADQILPLVSLLADATDDPSRSSALTDLGYSFGLLGGAMETLGTPVLAQGIMIVQASTEGATPPAPEDLANWSTALLAFLERPDTESAELLTGFSAAIPGLDHGWALALEAEARRIHIGLDPALLAARKRSALPEDISLEVAADVLPNVLEGMLRELPANAKRLGNAIRQFIGSGDTAPIDSARRAAHTLKGDANTVGVRGLANLTHTLEDLLFELMKSPGRLVPELALLLGDAADCVEEIADHLLGRGPAPLNVLEVYQGLLEWSVAVADMAPGATGQVPDSVSDAAPRSVPHVLDSAPRSVPQVPSPSPAPATSRTTVSAPKPVEVSATKAPLSPAPAAAPAKEQSPARTSTLSVSAEILDELQRLSGETLVMARQIDQRLSIIERMHQEQLIEARNSSLLLSKLDELITLRGAALQSTTLQGGGAVDPLELDQYNELHAVSRRLLEASADGGEYQRRLDALLAELGELRSQQEWVHADLQQMVQRARVVPFEQISGRLQRIVRQTARQLDREVELRLVGEQTLLDADLLDRVVEPLAHLLRNAIDHGLEDAAGRLASGKPQIGTIQVSVGTSADAVEICVEDNGRGLDFRAIQRKAESLGILMPGHIASEEELSRLILAPGFTTRSEATQVSGRGIGMDVVNQRIIELRGQLTVASQQGRGMSVTMALPVSQTIANVIVAHGHGLIMAAVASSVERILIVANDELSHTSEGQLSLLVDGEQVPVYPIEVLYGRGDGRLSLPAVNSLCLLARSPRGIRIAISVSSISDVSRVVVKPVSAYLPPVPSLRGMTLLGDGRLAAVVDVGSLFDALNAETQSWNLAKMGEQAQLPRVVVADDSLSVRRALTQLLEDAGYEVAAARDGLEAMELINATAPVLVMLDLEMPKLNGLEVTRFMRGRPQTAETPVLMITSRTGEKYRAQADDAGVTRMMGKPVTEDDLIATVRELTTARLAMEPA